MLKKVECFRKSNDNAKEAIGWNMLRTTKAELALAIPLDTSTNAPSAAVVILAHQDEKLSFRHIYFSRSHTRLK